MITPLYVYKFDIKKSNPLLGLLFNDFNITID